METARALWGVNLQRAHQGVPNAHLRGGTTRRLHVCNLRRRERRPARGEAAQASIGRAHLAVNTRRAAAHEASFLASLRHGGGQRLQIDELEACLTQVDAAHFGLLHAITSS